MSRRASAGVIRPGSGASPGRSSRTVHGLNVNKIVARITGPPLPPGCPMASNSESTGAVSRLLPRPAYNGSYGQENAPPVAPRPRWVALFGVLAGGVLFLAACGGGPGNSANRVSPMWVLARRRK